MAGSELSFVIVAYKNKAVLQRCLASIPQRTDWEIVVVDNSKNNRGFAKACNLGARRARGRFIFFLNPDCVINQAAIQHLLRTIKINQDIGVIAPALVNEEGGTIASYSQQPTKKSAWLVYSFLNKYLPKLPLVKEHWLVDQPKDYDFEVGYATGAALLMRRDDFLNIGGFDEQFFMYWEEMDLCRRFLARGKKIIVSPRATIMHTGAASTPKNDPQVMRWFRQSRYRFFVKHFGRGYAIVVSIFLRLTEAWRWLALFSILCLLIALSSKIFISS